MACMTKDITRNETAEETNTLRVCWRRSLARRLASCSKSFSFCCSRSFSCIVIRSFLDTRNSHVDFVHTSPSWIPLSIMFSISFVTLPEHNAVILLCTFTDYAKYRALQSSSVLYHIQATPLWLVSGKQQMSGNLWTDHYNRTFYTWLCPQCETFSRYGENTTKDGF